MLKVTEPFALAALHFGQLGCPGGFPAAFSFVAQQEELDRYRNTEG